MCFVLGKLSGGVLHRHRCFSSWRRSSVVRLLAPMLTLTRPGCQVVDKLFSFWRFKTTQRFCMVLWFLFWEPCLWICFFSAFVLNSCLFESLCGSSCITVVSTRNPRFAYVNYARMTWESMWTIFSWMLASQKCQDLRFRHLGFYHSFVTSGKTRPPTC